MIVERKPNSTLITDFIGGEYVKKRYSGYTENEAIARFKDEFLNEPFRCKLCDSADLSSAPQYDLQCNECGLYQSQFITR